MQAILPGQVYVWCAKPDYSAELAAHCLPLLVATEVAHAQRLRFPGDGWRYLVARGCLRLLLAHYLGRAPQAVPLAYGPYGKPLLAGEDAWLQFNLSHAGGLLLYAVACDRAVGVDVELIDLTVDWLPLACRVFAPEQVQHLLDLPSAQRTLAFYQLWSLHEALSKAVGCGFARDMQVLLPQTGAGAWSRALCPDLDGRFRTWSLWPLAVGDAYRAAVAAQGEPAAPPELHVFEFENVFNCKILSWVQ